VVAVVVVAAGIAESPLDSPLLLFLSSIFSNSDIFDKNEGSMAIRNYYIYASKKMAVCTKPSDYKSYNGSHFNFADIIENQVQNNNQIMLRLARI
jgi:hypothetical protein